MSISISCAEPKSKCRGTTEIQINMGLFQLSLTDVHISTKTKSLFAYTCHTLPHLKVLEKGELPSVTQNLESNPK